MGHFITCVGSRPLDGIDSRVKIATRKTVTENSEPLTKETESRVISRIATKNPQRRFGVVTQTNGITHLEIPVHDAVEVAVVD